MAVQSITAKFISSLGNPGSLIPITVKDSIISGSLTMRAYKEGGKTEGKDRFIDEFATEAVWLGGIPAFKKLFDLTVYKAAKLNPDVDVRIIANEEYSKWAVKNAQGFMPNDKKKSVKDALTDCLKDGGQKVKKLYAGKIITATSLALGLFLLMTKLKQMFTQKTIDKIQKESMNFAGKDKKDGEQKTSNSASFKGVGQNLRNAIMFNPVHNLKVIDMGIAAERFGCSRNKVELGENLIKEGGFFFFIYFFGNLAENFVRKMSDKLFNKPVDLNIDILSDKTFEQALSSGKIEKDLKNLPAKSKSLTEKLDFILKNPDNILVQSAKTAGIVKTTTDKAGQKVVDTSAFIDVKKIETLAEDLKNINGKFKSSGESLRNFLTKTKGLKMFSILTNIVLSCLFLGYTVPKLIYAFRKHKTGSTKFHVEQNLLAQA